MANEGGKVFNRDVLIAGDGALYVKDKKVIGENGAFVNGAAGALAKTAAYTMAAADSGLVTTVTAVGNTVITLPATVVGYSFTIVNGATNGVGEISVDPNASDKIVGGSLTGGDGKKFTNTLATSKKGDLIKLVADGVNGWFVTEIVGTWAAEA